MLREKYKINGNFTRKLKSQAFSLTVKHSSFKFNCREFSIVIRTVRPELTAYHYQIVLLSDR